VLGRATLSDTYEMGDRIGRPEGDLVELLTLRHAARRAFAEAGRSSVADADVLEIHAPFDSAEAMAYAPLGLCVPEDGPDLVRSGFGRADAAGPTVNPSGGPQTANPVGATALVRLAECALQVMGDAGERQAGTVRTAVATGQGGSTQFSTCTVIGA
jgi:acetyl-CoA C-acetyltransferase